MLAAAVLAVAAPARAADVFEGPVPRAACGTGSVPEPKLQGEMPMEYRESDRHKAGFRCNLEVIGNYPGEGAEWQNAWYRTCDYYDTTLAGGQQSNGTQVIDVSNPLAPKLSTALTSPAMLDPWETLKVNEARGLLAGVYVNGVQGTGFFDVYDVKEDCAHPKLLSSTPVSISNHEGNWAPDGMTYYATNFAGGIISSIDVSDPTAPKPISAQYVDTTIHGLSVSDDGTRVYQTLSGIGDGNGLRILDSSEVQKHTPGAQMATVGEVFWEDGSTAQHTVPMFVKGHPYVLFVDEGGMGMARIIDIGDETKPRVVSKLKLEIDMPQNEDINGEEASFGKGDGRLGTFGYNAHYCTIDREQDPTIAACSYFESGVRIFDIRDLMHPREIAYINVGGADPGHPGSQRNGGTSSYNSAQIRIVRERGEIWFTDQDRGFFVARFTNGAWPITDASPAVGASAPAPKRCTRTLKVSARSVLGAKRARGVRSATVYVNGKRVRSLGKGRSVVLRKLKGDAVAVKVVARTRSGKRVAGTRTFVLCRR
jgi:hypothetical protein